MATRLKFGMIAGFVGFVIGCGVAAMLRKEVDFPRYIVVASTVTFAACGIVAKKKWVEEVVGFFVIRGGGL